MKLLKTTFALLAFFSIQSHSSHAIFSPGWEKPLKKAEMEITHSKLGLSNIKKMSITLTHQSGLPGRKPTGMIVEIQNGATGGFISETLSIHRTKTDSCGSVEYDATLSEPDHLDSADNDSFNQTSRRFTIHLIDHSNRTCGGMPSETSGKQWQALIRQGFGYCGTMDATLTAIGNPEDLVSIDIED